MKPSSACPLSSRGMKKTNLEERTMLDLSPGNYGGGDSGRAWASRIIKMVETRNKKP